MLKRKLHSFGTSQTAVITTLALLLITAAALLVFLQSPAEAQGNDRATGNLALSSPNPGELVITWDAPSNAPDDYRLTWKKSDGQWHSYKNANTVDGGNAFPTGTSHTVTGLEEGTAYQARVRARYHNSGGKVEKSGPWSDAVEITISATPSQDGEGDSNEGPSTNPPGKPAGLLTAASHDSVLLSWDNPDDDGITGYQVLRGEDADNLAVLTDDTGSTSTSYTDDTVEAVTTYVYAVRGRNARGLGPQSDTVTVTTSAAPEEADPPPSERQIAGAEFTLDGQDLKTDGTCNEDTIGNITDACTINIDTTTATFAVVGTLDSDDRLNVKIGRDKAAVDAASTAVDQGDLRGTGQEETLTFQVGRNLMRLWGDEDGSPGGSEEHFYRVNVRRIATIEAVKSSIVEGEEEARFRITLSIQAPAGGVNVRVELTPDGSYSVGPIAQADFRVHTVNIPQGQTQGILEVMSSRNEIQSHTAQVNAAIQPGTGYTVGSDSEASVRVRDNDKVNVRFADGCGQTITVGEGAGEVSFDMVLDNPVSYDFSLVLTAIGATAADFNDFVGTDLKFLEFPAYQTRATATYPIIDTPQVEGAEYFIIWALRNALDDDILTPTCGESNPDLRIEIIDDDTANIVLDAPEEVTEGQSIRLGLGPRPNVDCLVPFQITTTLTITGDTGELQGSPDTSAALRVPPCGDPEDVTAPVYQTIDRQGLQGDRSVTFTITTLKSSGGVASQTHPGAEVRNRHHQGQAEQQGHRQPHHRRRPHGRPDLNPRHQRHQRTGRPDQRPVHLPVVQNGPRRHGPRRHRRTVHRRLLHGAGGGQGGPDQAHRLVHRRRGLPGRSHRRTHRRGRAVPGALLPDHREIHDRSPDRRPGGQYVGLPQRLAPGQERRRVEDPQLGCQPHRTLHDPLRRGLRRRRGRELG